MKLRGAVSLKASLIQRWDTIGMSLLVAGCSSFLFVLRASVSGAMAGWWAGWGGCEAAKWAHYRGILPSPGEPSKTHHNPYKTKHITFPYIKLPLEIWSYHMKNTQCHILITKLMGFNDIDNDIFHRISFGKSSSGRKIIFHRLGRWWSKGAARHILYLSLGQVVHSIWTLS